MDSTERGYKGIGGFVPKGTEPRSTLEEFSDQPKTDERKGITEKEGTGTQKIWRASLKKDSSV